MSLVFCQRSVGSDRLFLWSNAHGRYAKPTARFMLCLSITKKNWKGRCSNASMTVNKTGDLLRPGAITRQETTLFRRMNMSDKNEKRNDLSAPASRTVSLGGELTVNRLGFGAMRITGDGVWGQPKDPAAAIAVLRRAIDLGVNFIDTADSYGPNVSEELIAQALAPYPQDLVIATKGGWNRPGPNQWTHDASPVHLRKAVEGSLKRLRLDRIDVYQLHTPDPVVPLDASIETLANMQSEGKIRLIGLSK